MEFGGNNFFYENFTKYIKKYKKVVFFKLKKEKKF